MPEPLLIGPSGVEYSEVSDTFFELLESRHGRFLHLEEITQSRFILWEIRAKGAMEEKTATRNPANPSEDPFTTSETNTGIKRGNFQGDNWGFETPPAMLILAGEPDSLIFGIERTTFWTTTSDSTAPFLSGVYLFIHKSKFYAVIGYVGVTPWDEGDVRPYTVNEYSETVWNHTFSIEFDDNSLVINSSRVSIADTDLSDEGSLTLTVTSYYDP